MYIYGTPASALLERPGTLQRTIAWPCAQKSSGG